ncbi:MAG: thioredoxin fold domain-containing protein [Thermodesulfovibrio sp.]|nr:thioredoxin fold domain-containing protein [Thermodesulfovibrio sp.]MDW7998347.1 thioredoxin fold domain-containing protein [Thermodesulfovibrio sp.]
MKSLYLLLVFLFFSLCSCSITTNPCSNINEKELKETLKVDFDSIVEKNEIKGINLCQIVIQRSGGFNIFYAYPDGKTFVFGDIYQNGIFLSKATLEKLHEKVFKNFQAEIDKAVVFSYKPEGANKYVYMITDPDCPFCEKAKGEVKKWADLRKVEVKVILFPLESLHPQAKDKAIRAVCSGMKYDEYLNSKWTGQLCSDGAKKIQDTIALMKKININGTPSFISFNGKRIVGFSPEGLDSITN